MGTILTGNQLREMLGEGISEFKPVLGPGVTEKNKKSNVESNKKTLEYTGATTKKNIGDESKPVKFNDIKGGINNNKNNLDLEYDSDPDDKWKERVKKGVEGDATMGNNADKDDAQTTNKGSEDFFKGTEKLSKEMQDNEHILKTSGLVSKNIPMPKKATAFESVDLTKVKRLNFKNTQFLGESHMLSLIPEDYKKDKCSFIMKDKAQNEYLIEWKVNGLINEAVIKGYENKIKLAEEFNRIKNLYNYSSSDHFGTPTEKQRIQEEVQMQKGIEKMRGLLE